MGADVVYPLADFVIGYLAVMATPGPNMLGLASLTAMRGLAAALPFCAGLGAGAGMLAVALKLSAGLATEPFITADAMRFVSPLLLLALACWLVAGCSDAPAAARRPTAAGSAPLFCAGVMTSVTNPVTAAFLSAQLIGPLRAIPVYGLAVVPCLVFGFFMMVALPLSRPAVQDAVLRWHTHMRLGAAALLAAAAVMRGKALLGW